MDLLLIKLERIDDNFYKKPDKVHIGSWYTPEVVVRNTDSFSINGLEIISSKRQLFLHKKEVPMTNKEFDILELLQGIRDRYLVKTRFMIRFGERTIF